MRIRQILGTGLVGLALGVLAAGLAGPVRADEPDRALNFGVLNQQSPARTAQRWNPILKYLSEATGLRFDATVPVHEITIGDPAIEALPESASSSRWGRRYRKPTR